MPRSAVSGPHADGRTGPVRAVRPARASGPAACSPRWSSPGPTAIPCLRILIETVVEHTGLPVNDPFRPGSLFSLGPPGRIEAVFASAGFGDIASSIIDAPFRLPTVDRYIAFVRIAGGPVRSLLANLSVRTARRPPGRMRRTVCGCSTGTAARVGPASLILAVGNGVTGTKAGDASGERSPTRPDRLCRPCRGIFFAAPRHGHCAVARCPDHLFSARPALGATLPRINHR